MSAPETMVERAEAAIRKVFEEAARETGAWITEPMGKDGGWSYEGHIPAGDIVRAVLTSLRNPTQPMHAAIDAMAEKANAQFDLDPVHVFIAMIDAALAEAEGKTA